MFSAVRAFNTRKYAMPSVEGILSFSKRLKIKNLSVSNEAQKFKDKILISKIRFNHKNKSVPQLILKSEKVKKYLLWEIVDQEKVP